MRGGVGGGERCGTNGEGGGVYQLRIVLLCGAILKVR